MWQSILCEWYQQPMKVVGSPKIAVIDRAMRNLEENNYTAHCTEYLPEQDAERYRNS
jgi:hypothetical protein